MTNTTTHLTTRLTEPRTEVELARITVAAYRHVINATLGDGGEEPLLTNLQIVELTAAAELLAATNTALVATLNATVELATAFRQIHDLEGEHIEADPAPARGWQIP